MLRSNAVSLSLLVAAGFTVCAAAHADAKITIPAVIPYAAADVGSDDMRKECDWNKKLAQDIVEHSGGLAVTKEGDIAKVSGRKLVVSITGVRAMGGGGFTGPKWATLKGELKDGGKTIGSFENRRQTMGGGFGTCSTLDYIATSLGKDVGAWLQQPTMDAKLGDSK